MAGDVGMEPKYYYHLVGANFWMDALQAAVLHLKAPHLAAWTEARRVNAGRYVRLFAGSGLTSGVTLPVEPQGRRQIRRYR
jgi:dTDP-4-amino-4,6-dideoxygalactose transaminase